MARCRQNYRLQPRHSLAFCNPSSLPPHSTRLKSPKENRWLELGHPASKISLWQTLYSAEPAGEQPAGEKPATKWAVRHHQNAQLVTHSFIPAVQQPGCPAETGVNKLNHTSTAAMGMKRRYTSDNLRWTPQTGLPRRSYPRLTSSASRATDVSTGVKESRRSSDRRCGWIWCRPVTLRVSLTEYWLDARVPSGLVVGELAAFDGEDDAGGVGGWVDEGFAGTRLMLEIAHARC